VNFFLEAINIMAKVKCELSVIGDGFDPKNLTSILEISPSSFWIKGDLIPGKMRNRLDTCWNYTTGEMETLSVEDVIDSIIGIFSDKIDTMMSFVREQNLQVKLFLVIRIEDGLSPSLFLNPKTISFFHAINAEVDIDLYCNELHTTCTVQ